MAVVNEEKQKNEFKRLESDLGKRTSELQNIMHDMNLRLGTIETMDNDEDDLVGSLKQSKVGPMAGGSVPAEKDLDINFGEDDGVIIGEGNELKIDSGKGDSKVDSGANLQSSQIMSKGSSKPSILRKSMRDKNKGSSYKNDPFSSGVNSSKSPENMLKKKRKSPAIGGDKESKDMLKQIEQKIDDLRKSSYAEINRIESMMERN